MLNCIVLGSLGVWIGLEVEGRSIMVYGVLIGKEKLVYVFKHKSFFNLATYSSSSVLVHPSSLDYWLCPCIL